MISSTFNETILYDDDVSVLTAEDDGDYPNLQVCRGDLYDDVGIMLSQRSHPTSVDDGSRQSDPSIDEMITKLTESMMRSARSREMISKINFSELRTIHQSGSVSSLPTTTQKSRVHKAHRLSSKYSIGRSIPKTIGGKRENSVCGFLRSTKRW